MPPYGFVACQSGLEVLDARQQLVGQHRARVVEAQVVAQARGASQSGRCIVET